MALSRYGWVLAAGLVALNATAASSQVFVVGEQTATEGIASTFKPTNVPLPTDKLTERGRRELVRNLQDEQGFAHMALPVSPALTLKANGPLSPGPAEYRRLVYTKGQAAGVGDRVVITSMEFKGDRIVMDLNGGPYLKHRFLRHIQLNDNDVVANTMETATGSRITLVFPGPIPEISAPEVKSLLAPVIDFGVKTSAEAYADTMPPLIKNSIEAHEILVGMSRRMVLASVGAPESKVREQANGDPNGQTYEDWIYGHVPQTVRFVRIEGDRVTRVEIAVLGKPLEIHDKDELGGYNPPPPTREITMGDQAPGAGAAAPPTLRKPGEPVPAGGSGKVQFPDAKAQPIPAPPSAEQLPPTAQPIPGAPSASQNPSAPSDPSLNSPFPPRPQRLR